MLSIILPTGSMEEATLKLFEEADLKVIRENGSRGYLGKINDPRFGKVLFSRPQDTPRYVARGKFDLGITGQELLEETGFKDQVIEICPLPLTKNSMGKVKLILCVNHDSPILRLEDFSPARVVESEYPNITEKFFAKQGLKVQIEISHGATEGKPPHVCDAIVELSETGTTLRKNNLREIATLMESSACLIANRRAYQEQKESILDIKTLLESAISARGKVLLKFHLPERKLDDLRNILPKTKIPTIADLAGLPGMKAVEILVPRESTAEELGVNVIISQLKKIGATDIVQTPISKWVT